MSHEAIFYLLELNRKIQNRKRMHWLFHHRTWYLVIGAESNSHSTVVVPP